MPIFDLTVARSVVWTIAKFLYYTMTTINALYIVYFVVEKFRRPQSVELASVLKRTKNLLDEIERNKEGEK